jgi:arginyl-tRNA synthetase
VSISTAELKKLEEKDGIEITVASIRKDLKDLGIEFDNWEYESMIREKRTLQVLDSLKAKEEKEGAVWFAPNDDFLKDRESVLVKSDGSYTYFANDIAYHKNKFEQGI